MRWPLACVPALVTAVPLASQAPQPVPMDLWNRMTADLARIAGEADGRVGLHVQSLATGQSFSLHGDTPFPAASTIKVALLYELYRQSEGKGPARLTDIYTVDPKDVAPDSAILGQLAPGTRLTLRDLALFTVVVSDNGATNALIGRVGLDRVNAAMDGLGLPVTRLRRRMMDLEAAKAGRENLTTPRELAALLAAIHQGRGLSEAARKDLLGLLLTPKDGFLTRLLPEDLPVANKPGVLGGVRNDVGLFLVKGHPFVLAVLASHLRDERQAEAVIARLAQRAAACFEVAGAASPEGRLLTPLTVR